MIFFLILIITSIAISTIGIIYINIHRENYGPKLNMILNILLYLILGILFFTSYVLSTETYFEMTVALFLWKVSIITWVTSISMLSIIQIFVVKFNRITTLIAVSYALIGGVITSMTYLSNSIEIQEAKDNYTFNFENSILLSILIIYDIFIFSLMWYNLIRNYSKIRDKNSRRNLAFLTFHFTFIIVLFSLYIITRNILFRNIYFIIYLIGAFIALYTVIKRPALFIELTNKIFDFIIFHKSGILLYSYNFETGKEIDEFILKGSILIGINHILSNFINKKDQLNLIKMQERDIVLEYDNIHGYALLLTTNHKNAFIERAVNNFMRKFTETNREKLKNLKGLIDISEFRNAKEILIESFNPYIIKS